MTNSSETVAVAKLIKDRKLDIGDGYRAKNSELGSPGIPFARAGDINGGFNFEGADEFPVADLDRVGRKRSKPGDVVFTSKGTVGRFAIVREETTPFVYSPQLCYWRSLDHDVLIPTFLFYWMHSRSFMEQVNAVMNQTDMAAYVSLRNQRKFQVETPTVSTQRRIADILSAYDDLIENNNRRMALLEESIHLLYREWFVYLRFPGHERVEIVDGVPEGWEVRAVKDSFEYLGGGTPSRKKPELWASGRINWYSPTDLTKSGLLFMETSNEQINELGLAKSSAKLFPENSVMFTSRATIGAIAINTTPATTNQGFINCLPNDRVPLYFLYCWLKANTEQFIARATGATFKELSKGKFKVIPITLPSKQIVSDFNATVSPLAEKILNLQRQNQKLREARDLLLPRLMDGRIPV